MSYRCDATGWSRGPCLEELLLEPGRDQLRGGAGGQQLRAGTHLPTNAMEGHPQKCQVDPKDAAVGRGRSRRQTRHVLDSLFLI